MDFLGQVAIPLLKVRNCEKRWYSLKDQNLLGQAKGRVLLELDVIYNPVSSFPLLVSLNHKWPSDSSSD